MLKKRIVPILLWNGERLVKGKHFSNYRDVGHPIKSAEVYAAQDADELIYLDVRQDKSDFAKFEGLVEELAAAINMPFSVGGGIDSVEKAQSLIRKGADKVVLNSALYTKPELISDIAGLFGSQAVIAAVDYKDEKVRPVLFSHNATKKEVVSLEMHLKILSDHGVGEVLLQNIDCEGTMDGYDLENLCTFELPNVPILIAGGAGHYEHLLEALKSDVISAVVCGSIFNFSDSSPLRAKAFLKNYHIPLKTI